MQLNPYLNFSGNCEEAFKFYEKTLNGKIMSIMPYEGTPMADQVPAEWRNKVIHARMIVDGQVLMASDSPPSHSSKPQGFAICIGAQEPAEAERIFNALAEGGSVQVPIAETFWAKRFGMLVDRFGTPWMVNCEKTM